MLERTHTAEGTKCIDFSNVETIVSTTFFLLTQLMLPRVVGELNNKQIPAFCAAADTVYMRDVGALGCGSLQQTVHLGVGGVDKLDNGAGFYGMDTGQCDLLSGWRR